MNKICVECGNPFPGDENHLYCQSCSYKVENDLKLLDISQYDYDIEEYLHTV